MMAAYNDASPLPEKEEEKTATHDRRYRPQTVGDIAGAAHRRAERRSHEERGFTDKNLLLIENAWRELVAHDRLTPAAWRKVEKLNRRIGLTVKPDLGYGYAKTIHSDHDIPVHAQGSPVHMGQIRWLLPEWLKPTLVGPMISQARWYMPQQERPTKDNETRNRYRSRLSTLEILFSWRVYLQAHRRECDGYTEAQRAVDIRQWVLEDLKTAMDEEQITVRDFNWAVRRLAQPPKVTEHRLAGLRTVIPPKKKQKEAASAAKQKKGGKRGGRK